MCFKHCLENFCIVILIPNTKISNYQILILYSIVKAVCTLHMVVFLCVSAAADLAAGSVEHEAEAELHQDDGAEDPGVGGGEAVVLVQRAAAAARRDGGRDEAQHQQQPGHGHQRVVQEVQVLPHGHLDQSEVSTGSRDQLSTNHSSPAAPRPR